MVRSPDQIERRAPQSAADRAKILTKPFSDDADLNSWTARMVAAADEFLKNKRSDPLGGFLLR